MVTDSTTETPDSKVCSGYNGRCAEHTDNRHPNQMNIAASAIAHNVHNDANAEYYLAMLQSIQDTANQLEIQIKNYPQPSALQIPVLSELSLFMEVARQCFLHPYLMEYEIAYRAKESIDNGFAPTLLFSIINSLANQGFYFEQSDKTISLLAERLQKRRSNANEETSEQTILPSLAQVKLVVAEMFQAHGQSPD